MTLIHIASTLSITLLCTLTKLGCARILTIGRRCGGEFMVVKVELDRSSARAFHILTRDLARFVSAEEIPDSLDSGHRLDHRFGPAPLRLLNLWL